MAKSHASPGSLLQHPHCTHRPVCAPAGSRCPKPPALLDHLEGAFLFSKCLRSPWKAAEEGEGRQLCSGGASTAALPAELQAGCSHGNGDLGSLCPTAAHFHKEEETFSKRLQLLPRNQSQPHSSPPRRHSITEPGARRGTSPMAPAKPCQHQLQGQEWQKQRLGNLHSEKHLT